MEQLLENYVNQYMDRLLISGARRKEGSSKVRIRPVEIKNQICYQVTETHGPKELHKNYSREETIRYILTAMESDFRQLQLEAQEADGFVLVSKKGKATVKVKQKATKTEPCDQKRELSHNRKKNYILSSEKPIPFLVDLGIMSKTGQIIHAKYDKFRQMNRYLEFIEDILPRLPKDRELTILDFGCGKSYLTFAMYYYLKVQKDYQVRIIGLDLKADVIEHCEQLARRYGFDGLHFLQGDIASYEGENQVDMVVTLHACDTATDFALAKAVGWGAQVIFSVPCCQHELNGQIQNQTLKPVMKYGILKERMAALLTDGLRAQMLEDMGYQVDVLEFIDMEHTPKNLLIRAVRSSKAGSRIHQPDSAIKECMQFFHVKPTLEQLLYHTQEATEHEETHH